MKTIDFHTHLLSKDVSFDRLYDKVTLSLFAKSLNADKKLLMNEKFEGYVKTLTSNIENSNYVEKIVLLPVDGIYDNNGYYITQDKTVCSNTNDVLDIYNRFPNLIIPFLSVNPNRFNSLDLLDEYIEKGCKGVKFLQNYWNLDLNDKKYIPYFEKIKQHNLPIVIHTGSEYAIKSNSLFEKIEVSNQAIEIGCNVVLAHGGVSMFMETNPIKFLNNFNINKMCKDYEKSLDYMRKHDNVYVDLSAIISIFRSKIIKDLAENQKDIHNKLLFATDFPVPFSILFSFHNMPLENRLALEKIKNPFDRYVCFLNNWFESDSEIYTNYKKLIKE